MFEKKLMYTTMKKTKNKKDKEQEPKKKMEKKLIGWKYVPIP